MKYPHSNQSSVHILINDPIKQIEDRKDQREQYSRDNINVFSWNIAQVCLFEVVESRVDHAVAVLFHSHGGSQGLGICLRLVVGRHHTIYVSCAAVHRVDALYYICVTLHKWLQKPYNTL